MVISVSPFRIRITQLEVEMEIKERSLFNQLRPACTEVMTTPTVGSLCRLRDVLVSMETEIPPPLAEYAVFPLKAVLVQRRVLLGNERFAEAFMSCLHALWTASPSLSLDAFRHAYLFVCLLLGQDSRPTGHAPSDHASLPVCTEDICKASLELLSILLARVTLEHRLFIFARENLVMVGHCIAAILKIAQGENSVQAKLACMECLYGFTGARESLASLQLQAPPTLSTHHSPTHLLFTQCAGDDSLEKKEKETEKAETEGKARKKKEEEIGENGKEEEASELTAAKTAFPLDSDCQTYLEGTSRVLGKVPVGGDDVIGPALCCFLPGVVQGLARVVVGDSRTSSLVASAAVLTLTRFLALLMSNTVHAQLNQAQAQAHSQSRSKTGTSKSTQNRSGYLPGSYSQSESKSDSQSESKSDSQSESKFDSQSESKSGSGPGKPSLTNDLQVERTGEWLSEASRKTASVVLRVLTQITHPAWRVRVAVVTLSHALLQHCAVSLCDAVLPCCEALIALSRDAREGVAALAEVALVAAGTTLDQAGTQTLRYRLEDSLFTLCRDLDDIVAGRHGDVEKMAALNLLSGYLRLLGAELVHYHTHLTALVSALLRCLKMVAPLQLLEGRVASLDEPESGRGGAYRPEYVHFTSPQVEAVLFDICELLGNRCPTLPLVDHLLEVVVAKGSGRGVAVVILGRILLGAGRRKEQEKNEEEQRRREEELLAAVGRTLEVLLSPPIWDVPTQQQQQQQQQQHASLPRPHPLSVVGAGSRVAAGQLASGVVLLRGVLQCMGQCALALGGPLFSPLLMGCLYPLLQHLGGDNACLANQAYASLLVVGRLYGYDSLPPLLRSNADYLLSATSLRLRRLDLYPDSAPTMAALLEHGGRNLLPLVTDSIKELLSGLDQHSEEFMDQAWAVLGVAARCIAEGEGSTQEAGSTGEAQSTEGAGLEVGGSSVAEHHPEVTKATMSSEDVVSFFKEHWKSSLSDPLSEEWRSEEGEEVLQQDGDPSTHTSAEPQQQSENNNNNDQTLAPDYVSADNKPLPLHLKMAASILNRCPHFLPALSDRARLVVMDSACHCVRALGGESSTLLPCVHGLWPAFVARFSDSSLLVLARAFHLLLLLSQTCRDFLKRRVSRELWPLLTRRLVALATISGGGRGEGGGSRPRALYSHSHAYKLQRAMLRGCAALCHALSLSEGDAESLVLACLPYLSPHQPPHLRELAQTSLNQLAVYYPDTVWFVLAQLAPPPALPPHPSLKPLNLPRVVGWGDGEAVVAVEAVLAAI